MELEIEVYFSEKPTGQYKRYNYQRGNSWHWNVTEVYPNGEEKIAFRGWASTRWRAKRAAKRKVQDIRLREKFLQKAATRGYSKKVTL